MANGGLGGGVAMASEQRKQLGRAVGLAQVRGGKQVTEEEQQEMLSRQGQGASKRQLSRQGQVGGTVSRGRSLGQARQLGRGLGNRSLSRFRRLQ